MSDWANSILSQTYRPIQVVVVEDGSPDNTYDILKSLEVKFKKEDIEYKLIRNSENLSCGTSYNIGLQYVKGEYVGVLDSDDVLEPFACEKVSSLYQKYSDITWIYTQFDWCNQKLRSIRRGFNQCPGNNQSLLSMAERRIHGFGHWRTFSSRFPQPNKLFKEGLRCSVDKYMGYRLEEYGTGGFFDEMCYKYRSRDKVEKTVSSTKEAIEVWKKVVKDAQNRRKLYKRVPFKIIELREN